jgi:hypothetical protein
MGTPQRRVLFFGGGGLKCSLPYYWGWEFLAILADLFFLNNLGYV